MDVPPLGRMHAYGPEHLVTLVLLLCVGVLAVRWARRADRQRVDRALRIVGWVLLVNSVAWTAWGFAPWAWNIDESLPLHLSDVLRFVGALALITQRGWAIVLCYFWGLTLNAMSVLTPDLNYFVWPPLEFVEYWVAHGAGVLIPVVLVWGLGYRPTWRGYRVGFVLTLAWASVAATGNALAGTNYGYLNRAPVGASILDVLGPWPWYLLVEVLLIAGVWALMTWPWARIDAHGGSVAVPSSSLVRRRSPSTPRAVRPDPAAPPPPARSAHRPR